MAPKLNADQLLHLYARAGFGLSTRRLEALLDATDALDALFPKHVDKMLPNWTSAAAMLALRKELDQTKDPQQREPLRIQKRANQRATQNLWFEQMALGEHDLVEKMALFWHGHFACRTLESYDALNYTNILRQHGLGDFKTLLTKISQSAAMVEFLHLSKNKKRQPNEDFARELCELFTLGRDQGYGEADIKEIARCFTGWTIDENRAFYFDEAQHDFGTKRFMGNDGHYSGEDVFTILLENKQTANFLARKLYVYFVHPVPNQQEVQALADVLYESNYHLETAMRFLFSAPWFYAPHNMGAKIKSPLELLVGLRKHFDLEPLGKGSWILLQRSLDQSLYAPPNVGGWPSDRDWIDASRLAFRLQLPQLLMNNAEVQLAFREDYDANPMESSTGTRQARRFNCTVDWRRIGEFFYETDAFGLTHVLLQKPLRPETEQLYKQVPRDLTSRILFLVSTPEYQLC